VLHVLLCNRHYIPLFVCVDHVIGWIVLLLGDTINAIDKHMIMYHDVCEHGSRRD